MISLHNMWELSSPPVNYLVIYHFCGKFIFISNWNINQIFRLQAAKNPNQHFQYICCPCLVIPDSKIMVFWKRLHRPKIPNAVAKRFNNYHHWLFFYTLNTNNYMIHIRASEELSKNQTCLDNLLSFGLSFWKSGIVRVFFFLRYIWRWEVR